MCFCMSCVFVSSILFWFPQRTHYFLYVFRFLFMERNQDYNMTSLITRCKFLFSLFQSHVTCRWIKTIWVNNFCAAAIAYLFHNLLIRWEITLLIIDLTVFFKLSGYLKSVHQGFFLYRGLGGDHIEQIYIYIYIYIYWCISNDLWYSFFLCINVILILKLSFID